MNSLHKRTTMGDMPKAEPSSLLCSNNDDLMPGSAFGLTTSHFSDDTITSLKELGEVLRAIHQRLLAEGIIQDKL